MNILVTGSNGFIGQHLVKEIKNRHKLYQLINGNRYSVHNNKITANLLNINHIKFLLKEELAIDVVIHLAAKMCTTNNNKDFSLLSENIKIYENLVLIINQIRPKKVINFSSTAVYPNIDGEYLESSEIRPSINNDCLYGLAKFCGENILDSLCEGIDIAHLRVSQVAENNRSDRIFEVMKKELFENNNITVYGNGNRISGFIGINTLIKKINFFLENDIKGIYNTSEYNLSYKDLASNLISKYGDQKSSISYIDSGVSSKVIINNEKLKKAEQKHGL